MDDWAVHTPMPSDVASAPLLLSLRGICSVCPLLSSSSSSSSCSVCVFRLCPRVCIPYRILSFHTPLPFPSPFPCPPPLPPPPPLPVPHHHAHRRRPRPRRLPPFSSISSLPSSSPSLHLSFYHHLHLHPTKNNNISPFNPHRTLCLPNTCRIRTQPYRQP